MTSLKRAWRALGNRLSNPLEDAVGQSRQGWDRLTARNRKALPSRVFPLHTIRAAISWVTRLDFDRDAARKIRRSVRKLGKLIGLWPSRTAALKERCDDEQGRRNDLDSHREKYRENIHRIAIALVLAAAAVVCLAGVEFSIGEGGMEMLLDNPAQAVLGVKLTSLVAVGLVLVIASATKLSASAARRVVSGENRGFNVALVALCATLVFGLAVAFVSPRQEAVQHGSGAGKSGVKTTGSALKKFSGKPSNDGNAFPWLLLLLGVAPYFLGTVLLTGAQNTSAEKDTGLWVKYKWSGWRRRWSEHRFGRLPVAVDRAEWRIAHAFIELKRAIGEEEAARLVHAEGYRLTEEWAGYLDAIPALIRNIEEPQPGTLPSVSRDDPTRLDLTPERMVQGGPIRRALEDRYGNPMVERGRDLHARNATESLLTEYAAGARENGSKPQGKNAIGEAEAG